MRNFDLTPLFRSSVGFDRMQRVLDTAASLDKAANTYPPYDIEVSGEDSYRVTLAVAGFAESDLEITAEQNSLIVSSKGFGETSEEKQYLHRGIARRAFERRFELADHVKVTGASLDNGLLHIDLVREIPESLKPRRVEISPSDAKVLENKEAA